METNFNTTNFIEPTEKYKKEWSDAIDVKGFFNADLIVYAFYYKDHAKSNDLKKLEKTYNQFCEWYDLKYSLLEIYERFKDWDGDLSKLIKYSMPVYKNKYEK